MLERWMRVSVVTVWRIRASVSMFCIKYRVRACMNV
jgi:hypothetical protein